jgi:hypothetical protein
MVDAARQLILHTDQDVESVAPIEPAELAAHIEGSGQARQLVRLMVATSLADGPPSREQISGISAYADALHVEEPSLQVVAHLAKGRLLRFRLAFMRRSHIRAYLRNTHRMLGGVRPMIRGLFVARGVIGEDRGAIARYRALAELPEGTLGREFYCHYTKEGLAFPGEKSGFPVGALFHDFSHVLAGYDTSPEGVFTLVKDSPTSHGWFPGFPYGHPDPTLTRGEARKPARLLLGGARFAQRDRRHHGAAEEGARRDAPGQAADVHKRARQTGGQVHVPGDDAVARSCREGGAVEIAGRIPQPGDIPGAIDLGDADPCSGP